MDIAGSVLWIIGVLFVVIVAVAFVVIVRGRRYQVSSISEFQRHIAYMGHALADGGCAEIQIPGVRGPIMVMKTVHKAKPASLTLRISAGHQGRDAVGAMTEALEREHISHTCRFTKKQRLLRDVRIVWEAKNQLTPLAASHALGICVDAVGASFGGPCSIIYWGPNDRDYKPGEEDPPACLKSYRFGCATGKAVGNLARILRG
jgi:hypothetical protein